MLKRIAILPATLLMLATSCSSYDASGGGQAAPVSESRWVDKVALTDGATATFVDKCDPTGTVCPVGVELKEREVSVGDEIEGLKIGAISCKLFSKDIRGWRGGPEFVARKGKWNCTASIDENAAENSVSESGARRYPSVVVLAANL